MKAAPLTVDQAIPKTCTIADVCRILQVSRPRFYQWMHEQRIPFSEIRPRIGSPRYRGSDVQAWLDGEFAQRSLRAVK